ncbi:hypothetical protein D3C78_1564190 [compost metagenome]
MQLAQFVAAVGVEVVGQVTRRHTFGDLEGLAQGGDDLPGDDQGSDDTKQQREHGSRCQEGLGLGCVVVANGRLGRCQLLAGVDQYVAL